MKKLLSILLIAVMILCTAAFAEEEHTHSWSDWHVKTAATCTTDGKKVRMCSECGAEESETIKATGHDFGEWGTKTAATCTTDGKKVRMCSVCGTEESETIKATGHAFGEWVVTKEATCTEDGEQTRTCEKCGATETEVIEAVGEHTWNDGVVTKKATTTSYGEKLYTCVVCGATRTEQIAKKKSSSSSTTSSTSTATDTATAAATEMPAAEDDQMYSIVTDPSFLPEEYTEEKSGNVATYTAVTDNTELLHLHISLEMIESLKAEGIDTIVFNANGVSVTLPLSVFDSEMVQAVATDLGDAMTGYVLTVDPAAVAEDGTTAPAYILYAQTDVLNDITTVAEGIEIV